MKTDSLLAGLTKASLVALLVLSCACSQKPEPERALTPDEARALIRRLLPPYVPDRKGWAADMYAAFAALQIRSSPENICAVVAITEQESNFRVDPPVPALSRIAWSEIDKQAARVGVPWFVVRAALLLKSPNGKSYSERIDNARTELQLSDIFEDFIAMVPLGRRLLADRNPVRTGGPMQVSVAFAERHASDKPYPYPVAGSIRHEVFTRRGGMYFGIAHLLDFPVSYSAPIYRFADYNAGHYASRNAAFQQAVKAASGIPLALDGDLLRYEQGKPVVEPGQTELALRVLGQRLGMSSGDIRDDLELGRTAQFEKTRLYSRLFTVAEQVSGRELPRAVLPRIVLQSPKISRRLTTDWFANRVNGRYRSCVARAANARGEG